MLTSIIYSNIRSCTYAEVQKICYSDEAVGTGIREGGRDTYECYNTLFDLDEVTTTEGELTQHCSEPRMDGHVLKSLWHTNAAEESVSNASESATNTDPVYCTITNDVKPHDREVRTLSHDIACSMQNDTHASS